MPIKDTNPWKAKEPAAKKVNMSLLTVPNPAKDGILATAESRGLVNVYKGPVPSNDSTALIASDPAPKKVTVSPVSFTPLKLPTNSETEISVGRVPSTKQFERSNVRIPLKPQHPPPTTLHVPRCLSTTPSAHRQMRQ